MIARLIVIALALGAGSFGAETDAVDILPVRGNVYMLVGAGGNITVSVGADGVLLVDSGLASMSSRVLAAINQLSSTIVTKGLPNTNSAPPKPIRYIIDTHVHPDHTGGNEALARAGRTFTGGNVAGNLADAAEAAAIYAHENVLNRMTARVAGKPPLPFAALPTDTYHVDGMNLSHFFNGEAVQILHQPAAHTDGDSMVYFRGSDVLSTGDIFVMNGYPVIDLANGGSIQGLVASLNRILDIAVPEFRLEGGTMIVPGHGRLCDAADVAYYRDMVTIIRDRVQDLVKKHQSLDQVKASKPTSDYDGRYGNPDQFIEAVYNSLSR